MFKGLKPFLFLLLFASVFLLLATVSVFLRDSSFNNLHIVRSTDVLINQKEKEFFPPFFVSGSTLFDSKHQITFLHGLNWFGFETEDHVVQGLWQRSYKDMIHEMKYLGFNTVRLPVCHGTLTSLLPRYINYDKNPELKGLNSLQLLDVIVHTFSENNFFIVLDFHSADCKNISETPFDGVYTFKDWEKDILLLVKRYRNLPNVIGIDPKNEPHGRATWGTGSFDINRKLQVERIGHIISQENPNILIFVEGIGESSFCSSSTPHWWGGNFESFSCAPIDTTQIPRSKLVLSPHIYGPGTYPLPYFSDTDFPKNMKEIWEKQFGFLASHYFIVPGEFGGTFEGKDKAWQTEFIQYLLEKGIRNFYFWSWNPNSKDTGGIVKDDWETLEQEKYTNLKTLF